MTNPLALRAASRSRALVFLCASVLAGCGGGGSFEGGSGGSGGSGGGGGGGVVIEVPPGSPGNPEGRCAIPTDGQPEDVSSPTTVVGTGTPESCTGDKFIAAVATGGVITFNCGAGTATIKLSKPAKVYNDRPKVVIDGGGKIVLDGDGKTRILYMNTCDESLIWTTSHCQDQPTPLLAVQNLTFANGYSGNESDGGSAIFDRGGRLKVFGSRFLNNITGNSGPDEGGGAIRAYDQSQDRPIYVVNSTFGGAAGLGNSASNGGALSSIGVSWTVLNSIISDNRAAVSGGGIYNDGDDMTLSLCGVRMERNQVTKHGSAIFFVTNDGTGDIQIDRSVITGNTGGSWYPVYPQISMHETTRITVTNSTIQ